MISADIIFLKDHEKSSALASDCQKSCEKYGITATMVPGVSPVNLAYYEMTYPIKPLPESRAWDYEKQQQPMLQNKKSCFISSPPILLHSGQHLPEKAEANEYIRGQAVKWAAKKR